MSPPSSVGIIERTAGEIEDAHAVTQVGDAAGFRVLVHLLDVVVPAPSSVMPRKAGRVASGFRGGAFGTLPPGIIFLVRPRIQE